MSQFAILRTGKINSRHKLIQAVRHNADPNCRKKFADPNGTIEVIHGPANAIDKFDKAIERAGIKKIRKDAVLAVEFMASFSPEMKDKIDLDKWKKDTLDFFIEKYGKARVLQAAIHTDETTPHMHILVIPLIQKQHKKGMKVTLSARDMVGGSDGPKKLRDLQDAYAEKMKPHDLERGVRNSRHKHQTLRSYVREMTQLAAHSHELANAKPLDPSKTIKAERRQFLGIDRTDYKKAFNGLTKAYRKLKERYNKRIEEINDLSRKNKSLSALLEQSRYRTEALEETLKDSGLEMNSDLQARNRSLLDGTEKLKEFAQNTVQQVHELEVEVERRDAKIDDYERTLRDLDHDGMGYR